MDVNNGAEAPASASDTGLPKGYRSSADRAAALATTRPLPEDFAERALRDNVKAVLVHYGCAWTTFNRWCAEAGIADQIEARRESRRRYGRLPADFAQRAPTESSRALGRHYGVNKDTVAAWRKLVNIPAPLSIQKEAAAERRKAAPSQPEAKRRPVSQMPWARNLAPPLPQKDDSRAGRAQQFLQRSIPCFKAEVLDKLRTGYVVGGRSMSTDDMIAYAEAKGFDQGEWTRL